MSNRPAQRNVSSKRGPTKVSPLSDKVSGVSYDDKGRRVNKEGYVIPPQKPFKGKLSDSINQARDNMSGVSYDDKGRRVNKEGYVIPPQKSFMDKLRDSIGKVNDNVRYMQGGRKAFNMDHRLYNPKMGSDFTSKDSNVDGSKVGESIGVDPKDINRGSNAHRGKVGKLIRDPDVNLDVGGGSLERDVAGVNQGSVTSKPDLNTMTYEARAKYEKGVLDEMINSGVLSDEGREVLSTMSKEEQANFSAEQYYVQHGEIPTTFNHSFESTKYDDEQFNNRMINYYNLHGIDMAVKPNKDRDFTEQASDSLSDDAKAEYNAQRHYDRFGDLLTDIKVEDKKESSISDHGRVRSQPLALPELTEEDLDDLKVQESALQL